MKGRADFVRAEGGGTNLPKHQPYAYHASSNQQLFINPRVITKYALRHNSLSQTQRIVNASADATSVSRRRSDAIYFWTRLRSLCTTKVVTFATKCCPKSQTYKVIEDRRWEAAFQRLAIALWRGNATAWWIHWSRSPPLTPSLDGVFWLLLLLFTCKCVFFSFLWCFACSFFVYINFFLRCFVLKPIYLHSAIYLHSVNLSALGNHYVLFVYVGYCICKRWLTDIYEASCGKYMYTDYTGTQAGLHFPLPRGLGTRLIR